MPAFFDTNDFPAARRFAQWRECASNLFLPVDVDSRDPRTLRYRTARNAIEGVPIGHSVARDAQVSRAAQHIVDPAHFSRCFKERCGLPPSDYRALCREQALT